MDILKKTAELSELGNAFMLATVVTVDGSSPAKPGFRMAVVSASETYGTIGGGALEKIIIDEAAAKLSAGGSLPAPELRKLNLRAIGMECGGQLEMLIEYFGGRNDFILFGGGHIGRALSPMLELLGYSVTVFDNRPEIAEHIQAEGRTLQIGDYTDISPIADRLKTAEGCFIATHGHEWDQTVLGQVLATGADLPYIGMIGSKKKVAVIISNLRNEGITIPAQLYTPVGLKIGGDSAAEIAVSIAAEVVAVKNKTEARHMRLDDISS